MKNKQMPQGIYEQVINEEIKEKLEALDVDKYLIEKESIDGEEAKTILLNYISLVIKNHYDFIIVDEFHHAEAPSYTSFLIIISPSATTERMDGKMFLRDLMGKWQQK
jgi:hypothetical protein